LQQVALEGLRQELETMLPRVRQVIRPRKFWAVPGMPDGTLQQRTAQQLASDQQFAEEPLAHLTILRREVD
jgi:hypothetical protein